MSDFVDTLAILGILLVMVWIGMALQFLAWLMDYIWVIGGVVAVLVFLVAAGAYSEHQENR